MIGAGPAGTTLDLVGERDDAEAFPAALMSSMTRSKSSSEMLARIIARCSRIRDHPVIRDTSDKENFASPSRTIAR